MIEITSQEIKKINLAPYNPRKMNENEMKKLIDSLNEFGFIDPVIVNKNNTLIGGHQRIEAWKRLGNKKVPCIYVDLSLRKEKALNLALNKISGDWDTNKLSSILKEINIDEDIDVGITGFDEDELNKLIGENKELELVMGENEDDDEFDVDYIPQANVKMLQLYFSQEDYELVTKLSAKLMIHTKKENITDVIKECVLNECKSKKISI